MVKKHAVPSIEVLNKLLSYDRVTGILTWKERSLDQCSSKGSMSRWNKVYANRPAGCSQEKGLRVRVAGISMMANRICWVMAGNEPLPVEIHVDHIDRDQFNNRPGNLRPATSSQNAMNSKTRADSVSGLRGVKKTAATRNWGARIVVNGKRISLGSFPTKGTAAVAYAKAAIRYHGQFARF